jgi:hypothetical protein
LQGGGDAIQHEPDRETDERDARAREEIRALFERYRMTARRAEEAAQPAPAEPEEALALTGR